MLKTTTARLGVLVLGAVLFATGCASTEKKAVLEDQQRRAQSHFDLGVDHMANDRVALGLRELKAAQDLDPLNPRIQYALAEAYLRRGKTEEAETHLVQALAIYPDYHDARLHLSALYLHLERYEEAVAQARILVDDPTFPAPWRALTNQGWAEFQLGRGDEARVHLEQAKDFNPNYWPTLLDLGILEAKEGRRLEAVAMFQRALELKPGPAVEAEVNYRLAEIYISLGRRERAVGHLMTAVAQTPTGRWGKKSEEYLKLLR